ncbi:MAG: hypothetical protein LBV41_13555 [Cytophagaceae bacterium]|jgi:hypothetical protein|nr:hypothetical protein [Cytophagaceae bacterium]
MKISFSKSTCTLLFEEGEPFAGKKLYIEGEMYSAPLGFDFTPSSLQWLTYDDEGFFDLSPIDEEVKKDLIPYFMAEARKRKIMLQRWD